MQETCDTFVWIFLTRPKAKNYVQDFILADVKEAKISLRSKLGEFDLPHGGNLKVVTRGESVRLWWPPPPEIPARVSKIIDQNYCDGQSSWKNRRTLIFLAVVKM